MNTHPHSAVRLPELLKCLYQLGWYGGTHDLCTITIEGGFEHNLSGRGSEDWNLITVVRIKELKNDNGAVILPALEVKAEYFDDAIRKVLLALHKN